MAYALAKKISAKATILALSVFAGGAVLFISMSVLAAAFWSKHQKEDVGFIDVAALILVGFAAFVMLMNVLSFGAKYLGIIDKTQPFGLPEGSVRAILTLAFIVLVGVLAAYLVTNSDGRTQFALQRPIPLISAVPPADAESLVKSFNSEVGIASMVKTPDAKADVYDVVLYPRVDHRLSDDIAKQILTMLSTVLAAMIGFYFGSRTGGSDGGPAEPNDHFKMPILKDLRTTATDLLGTTPDDVGKTELNGLLTELNTMDATLSGLNTRYRSSDQLASETEADKKTKAALDARALEIGKRLDALKASTTTSTRADTTGTGDTGATGSTGASGPAGP